MVQGRRFKEILGAVIGLVFLGIVPGAQAQPAPTCGQQAADIVIMLDRTGSVSSTARVAERDAANSLLASLAGSGAAHNVAIGRFPDSSGEPYPAGIRASLQDISSNLATLQTAVTNAMTSSAGNTNLASAINVAQAELVSVRGTHSEKIIILISDGEPNRGGSGSVTNRQAAVNAANTAKTAGTRIVTIAFDSSGSTSADVNGRILLAELANQPSADNTGSDAVTDTERATENADGDDFFIAPTGDGIQAVFSAVSQTISCNDGNPCTQDMCNNDNQCQYVAIEGCTSCRSNENCNDSNPCTNDICGQNATCEHTPVTSGTCEDGNACTGPDVCSGTTCTPGTTLNCDDANPCTADSCDSISGCAHTPIQGCQACQTDGDCTDGNACNGTEACVEGVCTAGTAPVCNDGNTCTTDSCNAETGCVNTAVEGCVACNSDTAATVCNDSNPCTTDLCSESGTCTHGTVENGTACGDSDVCNGNETCQSGVCAAGSPLACNDGNACTADACDSADGCSHTTISCDDGNPCTADSCDSISGCSHTLIEGCQACQSDGDCSDGNACNGTEACVAGVCTAGTTLDCNDGNACTHDTCNTETGCVNAAIEGCVACNSDTASRVCADENDCTVDSCIEGACHHTSITVAACVPTEPTCGDHHTDALTGEECDDGNLVNGDGCSSTCHLEHITVDIPGGNGATSSGGTPATEEEIMLLEGSGEPGSTGGCSLVNVSATTTSFLSSFWILAIGGLAFVRRRHS